MMGVRFFQSLHMADVRHNIDPMDRKFILKTPEKDFSPERNKAVVEQTIREYDAMRLAQMKKYDEDYAERSDAVVSYLKSLDAGRGSSNLERYFGRKELARLRGLEIRNKLMSGMTLRSRLGQIIKAGE